MIEMEESPLKDFIIESLVGKKRQYRLSSF